MNKIFVFLFLLCGSCEFSHPDNANYSSYSIEQSKAKGVFLGEIEFQADYSCHLLPNKIKGWYEQAWENNLFILKKKGYYNFYFHKEHDLIDLRFRIPNQNWKNSIKSIQPISGYYFQVDSTQKLVNLEIQMVNYETQDSCYYELKFRRK